MHVRLLPLALGCAILAGCTTPHTSLRVENGEGGTGFLYVAESYDLYPTRRPEGEAWRLQDLRGRLTTAGACTEGYRVDDRAESLTSGRFFNGDIYRVTYRGHCGRHDAPAAPAEPMYTPMPMDDPVERFPAGDRDMLFPDSTRPDGGPRSLRGPYAG